MRSITVSTCNLNQWSLDFEHNKERIVEAVRAAKSDGSSLIITPELSLCGYSCLDAFLEHDTEEHSWDVLHNLLDHADCQNIIVDVGMPVRFASCLYNCRVVFYNKRILYIRPKLSLANDGLFREMRYFTPWPPYKSDEIGLREDIRNLTGESTAPFGDVILDTHDVIIGNEMCEELFTPNCPSIHLGLNGCEIICNSSASHWQLRKLDRRLELIKGSSKKGGSLYLYSNQQGCDGEARQYFDGCALIILNGEVLAQASQFSLKDVEVVSATVDLDQIWNARFPPARRMQASAEPAYKKVKLSKTMTHDELTGPKLSPVKEAVVLTPAEEIGLATGCWMWDYLRRSAQAGAFLPLSGGVDSCATAVMFFSACRLVLDAVHVKNQKVIADMRRMVAEPEDSTWLPANPQELCNRLFHTTYMGTENSSLETRERARKLAKEIGSYHLDANIDTIVNAFTTLFTKLFNWTLRYKNQKGGSVAQGLALQNIQSRSRMVLSYLLASTLTLVRGRPGGGNLLVLSSANVDECLRGYFTKYDCSSGDINPIGSISKKDLARYLQYAKTEYNLPILDQFLTATPTAELEPITESYVQSDEVDMGCTYDELGAFGKLRKVDRLGPYSMWRFLLRSGDVVGQAPSWVNLSPRALYERVRFLWHYFNLARHKQEILTPSLHAETYSPDSNRYDLLPFLRPRMEFQWRKIEDAVERLEQQEKVKKEKGE